MSLPAGTLLHVGIDDAPPVPMQMGAPEAGDFRGYEVDLLQELSARLSATLMYRRALWSVIMQELAAGEIDLICSAATVTPPRAQQVDFTRPHLRVALAWVTKEEIRGEIDLRAARIGVRRGTTAEDHVRKTGLVATMLSESNDVLYEALARGVLDAVIDDTPIARHYARVVSGLHYAGAISGTEGEYAIMLRRGDEQRRSRINKILEEMEIDGILPGLRKRWFGVSDLFIV